MDQLEQIHYLNSVLLDEMEEYRAQADAFPADAAAQRLLLRSLMNVRPPRPLRPDFLAAQDALLGAEREERGVVDAEALPVTERERNGYPGAVAGDSVGLVGETKTVVSGLDIP